MIELYKMSDIDLNEKPLICSIKIPECKLDNVCLRLMSIKLNSNDFIIKSAKYKKKSGFSIKFRVFEEHQNFIYNLIKDNGGVVSYERN